jgi:hypothetical protein
MQVADADLWWAVLNPLYPSGISAFDSVSRSLRYDVRIFVSGLGEDVRIIAPSHHRACPVLVFTLARDAKNFVARFGGKSI